MARHDDTAGSTLTMDGAAHSSDIPPGTVFGGDLRIVSKIGSGGMGSVYLAEDTGPLGRSCAVKILDNAAAGTSGHGRFLAEARIMASLRHPNIVAVTRFGTDDATGFDYYVMDEFLHTGDECRRLCRDMLRCAPPERGDGKAPLTLADLVDGGRSLPEWTVASIALQLLSAIDAAHSLPQPVVHRDIKPSNILFAGDGRAMLADFGIAKRLGAGSAAPDTSGWTVPNATPGTWMFAAPEQREGGAIVPATDYYSFGLVLFRALTGGMPSRSAALPTDIAPFVSKSWHGLFAQLLEPDPEKRLASAGPVRGSLSAILDDIGRRVKFRALARRMPLIAALVAALAAVAAIVAALPLPRQRMAESETHSQMPAAGDDAALADEGSEVEDETPEFPYKAWARQYADGLCDLLAISMPDPRPDASGRITVPDGRILLSGDIPEATGDGGLEIALDGGTLYFSPSSESLKGIVAECEDFIANAPDGASTPETLQPDLTVLFDIPIVVTARGGRLESADGKINALVAGRIACEDGADHATLSVFGLSSITLNRSSIDPRLSIAGMGRVADIGLDGSVRGVRWFEPDTPL